MIQTFQTNKAFVANTAPSWPWTIRAVQLDLARRYESVEAICEFTDFAASCGFNTLVLYLEARIRTTSFPFGKAHESYTATEMAKVVAHAAKLGIEVVPVISTLGHAEQFLEHDALACLAEEREGGSRFGKTRRTTFCPSQEATYDFLSSYLAEIACIFPSQHLHIGLDEAWNLGFCPLCRKVWEHSDWGTLYFNHVQRMVETVNSFGKRPWIWDDLLEYFPQRLAELPRDIVLCHWNYDPVIERAGAPAHFANRLRSDFLAQYEALGFDVLICPWASSWSNIETFTDYAYRHKVWGGFLTQWELSTESYERYYPNLRAAGKLWSSPTFDEQSAWHGQTNAVRALAQRSLQVPTLDAALYLRGALSENEKQRKILVELALDSVQYDSSAPEELITAARAELVYWELRDLIPQVFDPRRSLEDTALLRGRAANLPSGYAPLFERLNSIGGESDWWLVLRLFLPDPSGAPVLSASIEGHELFRGTFKPPVDSTGSHYTLQIPFTWFSSEPTAVTIEVEGYGGQGVAYLEVQNHTLSLVPDRILACEGEVSGAERLLMDDSHAAFLGHPDVAAAIHNPALVEDKAILKVALRRCGPMTDGMLANEIRSAADEHSYDSGQEEPRIVVENRHLVST